MAFAFFRRRQKMVIIIMAVLMVSFLIGFQGFSTLLHKRPGDHVVGRTREGKIRFRDLEHARWDMEIVRMLGLADPARPTGAAFLTLSQQSDPALAYALLYQEAQASGIRVSEIDLDSFLARLGLGEDVYSDFLGQLRHGPGISEKQFRGACARWLMIDRLFLTSLVQAPPSELSAQYLCRDLGERIALRIIRFPTEKFLDTIDKTIDPNEVQQFFARYRATDPNDFQDENSLGFGYRVPNRVKVLYMHFPREVVARVTRPSDEAVRRYYMDRPEEFLVTPAPRTQPAESGPAGEPQAPEAAPTGPVRKTFAQAKAEIIERLSVPAAQEKLEMVVARARELLLEYAAAPQLTTDAYRWTRQQMVRQADANAALATRLTVAIRQEPLEQAVEKLARLAKLQAIAFPWGRHGAMSLDPAIQVTVEGQDITLGEALDRLCESANWPAIRWSMCQGFDRTLFALSGPGAADFFPVVVAETPLLGPAEVRKDELLGFAFPPGSQRVDLAYLAFTSEPFGGAEREALKLNEDGPTLNVWGDRSGSLIWRLTAAEAGHAPQTLDDDLRRRIEKDILTQRGMEAAQQRAQQVRTVAEFEATDANGQYEAFDTSLFARKNLLTGELTSLPALELPPNPAILKFLLDAAFALAPVSEQVPEIGIVRLPSIRQVLVMRRIDYEPLTRQKYQERLRPEIVHLLWQIDMQRSFHRWFALPAILERTAFVGER